MYTDVSKPVQKYQKKKQRVSGRVEEEARAIAVMASFCDPDIPQEFLPAAHPFHDVLDEERRIPICGACTLMKLLGRISLDVEQLLRLLPAISEAIKKCEEEEEEAGAAMGAPAPMEAEQAPSPFFSTFTQTPEEFLGCDLLDIVQEEQGEDSAVDGGEKSYGMIWWRTLCPSTPAEVMAALPFSPFTQTPEECVGFDLLAELEAEEEEENPIVLSDHYYSGQGGHELPFFPFTQSPEEFLGSELLAVIDGQREVEPSTLPAPGPPNPASLCSSSRSRPASVNCVAAAAEEEEERASPRPSVAFVDAGDDWEDGLLHDGLDALAAEATTTAALKKLVKALNKSGEREKFSFLSSGSRRRHEQP